jgi:TRAP-type C4-dicarboxylate transport system permease small subunit
MTEAMPPWIARTIGATDRLAHALAYASGALLVALGLFITVDVLGRRFGGPYTGATDELSVFAMALAATWALAYTSAIGKHIRIDLTLHWFPPRVRRVVDYCGIALLCVFASLLAVNCGLLAYDSFAIDAVSMSKLAIPLVYPQAAMAAGFTFLAIHAAVMLLASPYRDLDALHESHRGEAEQIQEI